MVDITLAIDAGGSQTKAIYALGNDGVRRCLSMSTEVEQIKKQRLEEYLNRQGWVGSPAPAQRAWVEWNDEVFVLGRFAQNFNPEDRIKERKYENALHKVLAIVGIIIDQHKIPLPSRKPLTISLGVLLPWNEYNDRTLFENQLKVMVKDYYFQSTRVRIEVTHFLCRPEGGGVAASYIRHHGIEWLRGKQLGVLMFGHRNTTVLHFEYGELKLGDSPLLGFSVLLDRVIELVGGLDRDILAAVLSQAMSRPPTEENSTRYEGKKCIVSFPKWVNLPEIQQLTSAKNPSLRHGETIKVAQAISLATEEYWEKVEQWLKRSLPENLKLDSVLIGGGASKYLRPKLERYFNSCEHVQLVSGGPSKKEYKTLDERSISTKIDWCESLQAQVKNLPFPKDQRDDQNAAVRFVDCFGLFDYLISSTQTFK